MAESQQLNERAVPVQAALALMREGVSPKLARILAARGLTSWDEVAGSLKQLYHWTLLKGAAEAASIFADYIEQGRPMLVVADYDCDGATACAVAVRGLRAFGAQVEYVVPDRMVHGYGLTPSVVELAFSRFPQTQLILTVDNGVASHDGVAKAHELGVDVVVTDHHLPSKTRPLPDALCIVDPAQEACGFPSKALAGVGVIWYVLWALQDELKRRGKMPADFRVSSLLPLVAVGTVADVVPLDRNNRILVQAGLDQIRQGKGPAGIAALALAGHARGVKLDKLRTTDIAFGIGPRINAAGRLESMARGIECLLTDDPTEAASYANELDSINQLRKEIEHETVVEAVVQAEALIDEGAIAIVVHRPDWHAGVIGIVAGRIKERRYRPTFVLTTDPKSGEIKGSGRSVPGFNLKDALDQVDKQAPGVMKKFGGHAMAAGVTLNPGGLDAFKAAFETQARALLDEALLSQRIDTDGALEASLMHADTALTLGQLPWGQLFPEPVFCNEFNVLEAKLGGVHKDQLTLVLGFEGHELRAVRYRHEGPVPDGQIKATYKLDTGFNKFGKPFLKLLVDQLWQLD